MWFLITIRQIKFVKISHHQYLFCLHRICTWLFRSNWMDLRNSSSTPGSTTLTKLPPPRGSRVPDDEGFCFSSRNNEILLWKILSWKKCFFRQEKNRRVHIKYFYISWIASRICKTLHKIYSKIILKYPITSICFMNLNLSELWVKFWMQMWFRIFTWLSRSDSKNSPSPPESITLRRLSPPRRPRVPKTKIFASPHEFVKLLAQEFNWVGFTRETIF